MKTLEDAVSENERMLCSLYDCAPAMLGIVEIPDGNSDILHVSSNTTTARRFGKTPDMLKNRSAVELGAATEPIAFWIEKYRSSEKLGLPVCFEIEQETPEGRVWLSATVNFIGFAASGKPRFSFDVEEITARKRAELEIEKQKAVLEAANEELARSLDDLGTTNFLLASASRRFQEMFQGLPVACFTYGADGSIFDWNRACEVLFGWLGSEVIYRTPWDTIWAGVESPEIRAALEGAFEGQQFDGVDETVVRPDGQTRHVLCSILPLHDVKGQITGAICASLDISDRKRAEQELEKQVLKVQEANALLEDRKTALEDLNAKLAALATTDGLTGLKNHRAFQQFLEQEFERAGRYGRQLSVILLDVDAFKNFNDTFGHPAGDRVLITVARTLETAARDIDFVARYGGEEFAVVLPDTGAVGAAAVAERIRLAVEEVTGMERPITVSLGVASRLPATPNHSELIARADEALYTSKRDGRNRMTIHQLSQTAKRTSGLGG